MSEQLQQENEISMDKYLYDEQANIFLTELETKVLDVYHEKLPFWNNYKNESAFGVLAAFDSMSLPLLFGPQATSAIPSIQLVQGLQDGLAVVFRWLAKRNGILGITPKSDDALINDAGNFLQHATKYANLSDMHICYRRKLVTARVEPERNVVRFNYQNQGEGLEAMYGWIEHTHQIDQNSLLKSKKVVGSFGGLDSLFNIPHKLDKGFINISDLEMINSKVVSEVLDNVRPHEIIELSDDIDLQGFTMGDLRLFWKTMFKWAITANILFISKVFSGVPQHSCSATQVVDTDLFYNSITELTGIDYEKVKIITDRFVFPSNHKKPDIILSPFVREGDRIAWSSRLIMVYREERNVLKIMARNVKLKQYADNIIGDREPILLRQMGQLLAKYGYAYKLRTDVNVGDLFGEVDILAWTKRAPNQILVVEGKALLAPDEINEVDHVTDELIKGQDQLKRCEDILFRMSIKVKKEKFRFVPWEISIDIYSFVLSPEALPNNRYDHSKYPSADLNVLRNRFTRRNFKTPKRIVTELIDRPWLDGYRKNNKSIIYRETTVDNVLYELPACSFEEK